MSESPDENKKRVDLHGNLIKEGGGYVKTGAGEAKNEVEKGLGGMEHKLKDGGGYVKTGAGEAKNEVEKGLGSIGDKFKAGAKAMGFKKKEDSS